MLSRVIAQAKQKQQSIFYMDFQSIDEEHMSSLKVLNRYIAYRMQRHLKLDLKVKDCWDEGLGAKDNFIDYIEEALLSRDEEHIIIIFDEADMIFRYDYRNDFFGMMRAWHTKWANDQDQENWGKLTILIGHSTEPTLWIQKSGAIPIQYWLEVRNAVFQSKTDKSVKQLVSSAATVGQ